LIAEVASVDINIDFFNFFARYFVLGQHRSPSKPPLARQPDGPLDLKKVVDTFSASPAPADPEYGLNVDERGEWIDAGSAILLINKMLKKYVLMCFRMNSFIVVLRLILQRDFNQEKLNLFQSLRRSILGIPFLSSAIAMTSAYGEALDVDFDAGDVRNTVFQEFYFTVKAGFEETSTVKPIFLKKRSSEEFQGRSGGREEQRIRSRSKARALLAEIRYVGSPFFEQSHDRIHYKVGRHFDRHFTPILLIPNRSFANDLQNQSKHCSKVDPINSTWSEKCNRHKILNNATGEFYVLPAGFSFVSSAKSIFIHKDTILYIFRSFANLKPNAIQIFTTDYKCFVFEFPDQRTHAFFAKLRLDFPCILLFGDFDERTEAERCKQKWLKYEISTFDYLMMLNILSGRTFLDSRIYPFFPVLEGRDGQMRDLSKNLCFMSEGSIELHRERTKCQNFTHPSLYSNPFVVSHFLVRMEPFARLHISLQDGSFDAPGRLFLSIDIMIDRISSKMAAIRELTPEFFCMHDFMLNSNDFDLGEGVGDVGLPSSASSAPDYIYKNRRLLESERIGEKIGEWIDLVWGVKSRGKTAIEELNSYDPALYNETAGSEEHMNVLGQVPRQLFFEPHPSRAPHHGKGDSTAVVLQNISTPIKAVGFIGRSRENLKAFVLGEGRILCVRLSAKNFETKIVAAPEIAVALPAASDAATGIAFAFTKKNSPQLSFATTQSPIAATSASSPHLAEITAIAASSEFVLTGGADGCVTLWRPSPDAVGHVNFLLAHAAPVTAVAISPTYGIAISADLDSTMIVATLPNLAFIRAVAVEEPPLAVLVGEHTGTIVAVSATKLRSFTVNGGRANSADAEGVVCACSLSPRPGVDLVAMMEETMAITLLDIFTLERKKMVWRANSRARSLSFHSPTSNLVVVTNENTIVLLPIN
jgi:hypothetical protein